MYTKQVFKDLPAQKEGMMGWTHVGGFVDSMSRKKVPIHLLAKQEINSNE